MIIVNRWRDFVSEKTLTLLSEWVEYYICNRSHGARLPTEGQRYLLVKSYNKLGQAIFNLKVLEGLDFSRSTLPKEFNRLDEFTMTFRQLEAMEQLVIIAYIDPFEELREKDQWERFLNQSLIRSNAQYDRLLSQAVIKLQKLCEKKGLVNTMKHEIRTWEKIAKRLSVSVFTARKIAKDPKARMPVTMVGGTPVTTEEYISKWLDDLIEKRPYWKISQEREKNKSEE